MEEFNDKHVEINALLNGVFSVKNLREVFDKRLHDLNMSQTAVQKLYKIERRTLNGILDGTQKKADTTSIKKLANFLNIPIDELVEVHSEMTEKNFTNDPAPANVKRFIKESFDLMVLKKAGFIESVTDFQQIEKKIVTFFGFSSIFEYKKRSFDTAFSAGAIALRKIANGNTLSNDQNTLTTDFWLTAAKALAARIDNPYRYERKSLVSFFPQIRWYTRNVEYGLINVIKELFKFGITVLFQPRLSTLHVRGATFMVNNKPCIVLTDYRGFYPTLWHCLIHELYHVLFDLIEISANAYSYHISQATEEVLAIHEKEVEADEFAQEYLFSQEKMQEVKLDIYDHRYVEEIAKDNNVHSSIIHSYFAFEKGKSDKTAWVRAKRYMPDVKSAVYRIENSWNDTKPIEEFAKKLKSEIYH